MHSSVPEDKVCRFYMCPAWLLKYPRVELVPLLTVPLFINIINTVAVIVRVVGEDFSQDPLFVTLLCLHPGSNLYRPQYDTNTISFSLSLFPSLSLSLFLSLSPSSLSLSSTPVLFPYLLYTYTTLHAYMYTPDQWFM